MESPKVSSPARFCWLGSVLLCGPLILLILFTRHSWGSERGHQLNIPIYVEILQENVHWLEYTQMQTERVILTPPCSSHGADLPNLSPCPPHRVSPLPPAWLVPPCIRPPLLCPPGLQYAGRDGDWWRHHMRSLPTFVLVQRLH